MITNAKELNPDQQIAFAAFLKMEIRRHEKDIQNALRDLDELRLLGVPVDEAPDFGFVVCGEVA
jgi:hypothetical protein